MPIQINGKLRDKVEVPAGISERSWSRSCWLATRSIAAIGGRQVAKIIHAGGGRLVNIVLPELSPALRRPAPSALPASPASSRRLSSGWRSVSGAVDAVASTARKRLDELRPIESSGHIAIVEAPRHDRDEPPVVVV